MSRPLTGRADKIGPVPSFYKITVGLSKNLNLKVKIFTFRPKVKKEVNTRVFYVKSKRLSTYSLHVLN